MKNAVHDPEVAIVIPSSYCSDLLTRKYDPREYREELGSLTCAVLATFGMSAKVVSVPAPHRNGSDDPLLNSL